MTDDIRVNAALIQQLAALSGLILTPEQAAAHVATLRDLLAVDAAIARLDLGNLPATGYPWEARTDVADHQE